MVCAVITCKDYTKSPGMDLCSKNLYDEFKDEIWEELGPLDPDWFHVLTTQTSTTEENVSDLSDELCANQEGLYKTHLDKTAPESQLFSTPKLFKCNRVVSPGAEDERSILVEEKDTRLWKETQSPHLFLRTKEEVPEAKYEGILEERPEGFDLLHTTNKTPVNHSKKISESLRAHVDPDISWTSSLNTPPAIPSTLILTKTEERPYPMSVSSDKNVVFVRKLFPSLSNSSSAVAKSQTKCDLPLHQGMVNPDTDQNQSHDSSLHLQSPSGTVWRPKLPDAIEDGDVRSAVASVLDGAENVLSMFFTNSSSSLRKVKTDRVKRKQNIPTKDKDSRLADVSTVNSVTRTDDEEPDKPTSPLQLKSGDVGTTQWSPLSLSEIPHSTVNASEVDINIVTERLPKDSKCSQLVESSVMGTYGVYTRKKRKFVYSIDSLKTHYQGKETQSTTKMEPAGIPDPGHKVTVKPSTKSQEEHCHVIEKETQNLKTSTENYLPLSVQPKGHDLDMSQLCRDFAQEFSQMLDPVKRSQMTHAAFQKGFSPSACLTALKQAKQQKAKQANISATNQNHSIIDSTVSDSGFQSAVADVSHITTFPSSESSSLIQRLTGFKSDIHRAASDPAATGRDGKRPLNEISQECESDVKLPIRDKESLEPGEEIEMHIDGLPSQLRICTNETENHCFPLTCFPDETAVSVPSIQSSGFKTASNSAGQISSALFEVNEAGKTELTKGAEIVKNPISNSNILPTIGETTSDISCQLTVSQKADVTELCTLLEEADTQFEFTQFKTAKPQQPSNVNSPEKAEKDLGPDFLVGIDFDDSFSADAEKHTKVTMMRDKTPSNVADRTSCETPTVTSLTSEGKKLNVDTSKQDKNPLLLGAGFKTARGNMLSVSKKCLSKAKALFADLEGSPAPKNLAEQKSSGGDDKTKQSLGDDGFPNRKRDENLCHSGFQMVSGREISISEKAMQEADALFQDVNISASNTDLLEKPIMDMEQSPVFFRNKKKHFKSKHIQQTEKQYSEEPTHDFENVCAGQAEYHPATTTLVLPSKNLSSNQLTSAGGFSTASGKKVSVSADALKKAECLLNDVNIHVDAKKVTHKSILTTGHHTEPIQSEPLKNGGFQTASGKGVVISSSAFKKAETLLNECKAVNDEVIVRPTTSKMSVQGTFPRNGRFLAASGKPMVISSEALQKAKALFSDITLSSQNPAETKVFFPSENQPSMTKNPSSPSCTALNNLGTSYSQSNIGGGFPIASRAKISVLSDALKKAKCLLNNTDTVDVKKQLETTIKPGHFEDQFPALENGEFQTASGHGVTNSLLSEYCPKMPTSGVSAGSCGFLLASGKPMAISSEALQKAEALFSEINSSAETPAAMKDVSRLENPSAPTKGLSSPRTMPSNSRPHANNQSTSGGGLRTARGTINSADAVKNADSHLNEIHTSEHAMKDVLKTDHLNDQFKVPAPKHGGFQTASGKGVFISPAALKKAKSLLSECEAAENDTTLSCSKTPTSKNFVPSAYNPSTSTSGVCTAVRTNISTSAEALEKAECSLNESHAPELSKKEITPKDASNSLHVRNQIQVPAAKHCEFQTAGGKGVVVSPAALKRAKSLLSESVDNEIFAKSSNLRMKICSDSPRDCGFVAASGKPMTISAMGLQTAQCLFSDITSNDVSDTTRSSDKKQDSAAKNAEEIDSSFMTVAGKSTICNNVLPTAFNNLTSGGGFSTASGKKMTVSDEAMTKARSLFEDGVASEETNVKQMQNLLNSPNVLKEVGEDSVSEIAVQELDGFFQDFDMDGNSSVKMDDILPTAFSNFTNGGGFSTASGKKVTVSDDAITKARSLFEDGAASKDANVKQMQKHENLPPEKCVRGDTFSFPAQKMSKSQPGSPSKKSGFLAVCGKHLASSSDPHQKAKELFNDINVSSNISTVSPNNTGNLACGFTTAGGTKVHMSAQSLLKAQSLFKDFSDEESHYSNSNWTSPPVSHKSDLTKVKNQDRTLNVYLTSAEDKDLSPKQNDSREVQSFQCLQESNHNNEVRQDYISVGEIELTDASEFKKGLREERLTLPRVGNKHDVPAEKITNEFGSEVKHTNISQGLGSKQTEGSSHIVLQTLNLSGCTETQQEFLAQEALDCTKALLEDESLAGKGLSVTLENGPLQELPESSSRSVEWPKTKGKRVIQDADISSEPPLKRRLLDEFDRTVEPKGSTLHPQKSCPSSVMKDRRAFKYNVSPYPNITGPHRSGNKYVETRLENAKSTQHSTGSGRATHSKMPAFVPPFVKNAKTEAHKSADLNVNAKTSSVFVPPFKKQKTVIHEETSKPEEEKNKRLNVCITPSTSTTFIPPTKKAQGSSDGAGEDKTKIPADAADNYLTISQHVPGCGFEDSALKASCLEDLFSRSQEVFHNIENVELARDMQDMRIRKKKRQKIRPIPGSLFLTKTSGVPRISLKTAVNRKLPARCTHQQLYKFGVHQHVLDITSETAETFRFSLQQFSKLEALMDQGGVQLADGGWLIPSNDGTAGKEEFHKALCDTPGVDPKLISEEWVFNHYRWILWKQASMERAFPETMGSMCLTPEQILLQLKYRYDVEIDHSRRSALRKIMEKDDTAVKTMVLCVCGVVSRGHSPVHHSSNDAKTPQGVDAKVEPSSAVVWLTDGWYAIKALLDDPLTAMLHKGRLTVGGKLIIHGSQLMGSQDACSPLEAPESLMLKICSNSTRPARWDTKLGFHRNPRPFLLPLSSLYSNGGPVGCVDITILRSYPIQWMERKSDGGVVFRSVRAEEKEARRYSNDKQKAMEVLFAKIQSEFEKEQKANNKPQCRRRAVTGRDIANLQDGEELYEAVGDDLGYFEAHLSHQQVEMLQSYRRSLMEKTQGELQDRYRRAVEEQSSDGSGLKRDVTPVWRLCVADSMHQSGTVYQLNLWRPSSDLQSLLKESCRYKVYNLTTSEGKKRSGIETVQLTGTKKTQFQDLPTSQEWLSGHFQPRVSTNFVDLRNTEFQSLCGEVDLTGLIINVVDEHGSSPAFYLVDGSLNFVKVRCFSSFAQSGLEDVVKPRMVLALSNLQLRGQSTSPTPVVYAGDLTVFSANPKETHLQESLCRLRTLVQSQENFFQAAKEKLLHLITSDGPKIICSPALHPQTPICTTDKRHPAETSLILQQPVRNIGSITPVSRNPPVATSSTEKDPKSLKRRRALDYLSRVPSPPALSHLSLAASPCVKKTFNPPRKSTTPSTLKTAQTPAPKPAVSPMVDEYVNDEELAMIDTQKLHVGDVL